MQIRTQTNVLILQYSVFSWGRSCVEGVKPSIASTYVISDQDSYILVADQARNHCEAGGNPFFENATNSEWYERCK